MDIKQKVNSLPLTSGVYFMKNKAGKIIYIGKASVLRRRVQSYFVGSAGRGLSPRGTVPSTKTDKLVLNISDIDYIETASEAEALILEASLIKKHKPRYNIDLKDDKSYPYIVVTKDAFPRISIERPRIKKKTARYFGPYVNAKLIRQALSIIRKIFLFRTCDPFPKKECLDYHIELCDGPCIGKVSKSYYKKSIRNVCFILDGKKDTLYRNLRKDMEEASLKQKFEKAALARDQLRAISALYSGTKDINYYKQAEQLKRILNLPRNPERIEAFDISNIYGNQSVGSCAVFLNGKPDKKNYRRFKIKSVVGIDDFSMIAEIVRRRYSRLKKEGKAFPDLIVVDGGKGQLSAAVRELKLLRVNIPIISLAKREEEIFAPNKRDSIKLSSDSLGLNLLKRLRDESHRFAINYHRLLRSKEVKKK
ncbi:MAG: excinuclease ABC subunit UvrC [Candidatus Zapsychrus exili]|nr:excinuclease ABC subunit UvrC [Candidatus Zapsychrus exili]